NPLNGWIRRRIFPGAQPPTLRQMMEILEPRGFSVLDVENLRLHYARTLEHWLERFEKSLREVSVMFDEKFVRAWRLYLAGSAAAGSLPLFWKSCNWIPGNTPGGASSTPSPASAPAAWETIRWKHITRDR